MRKTIVLSLVALPVLFLPSISKPQDNTAPAGRSLLSKNITTNRPTQAIRGHSVRSAWIGSIEAARRAGINPASSAQSAKTAVAITNITGS